MPRIVGINIPTTVGTLVGGSTASSSLILESTSGVGTSDSILMKVGNNGAVTAMTVNTSGYVGVGTGATAITRKLLVSGACEATAITDAGSKASTLLLASTSGGVGDGGSLEFGAGFGAYGQPYFAAIKAHLIDGASNTAGDLKFFTRNAVADTSLTERMRIDYAGNVGIGTSTPTALRTKNLEVSSSGTNDGAAIIIKKRGTGNATLRLGSADASTGMDINYNYPNTGDLGFFDIASSLNRMIIDSAGNVGIGTATPKGLLSVKLADASGNTSAWDSTYAIFGDPSVTGGKAVGIGFNATSNYGEIRSVQPGTAWKDLYLRGDSLKFYTAVAGASTLAMTIDTLGNVGIGTTPANGKVNIKGISGGGASTEVLLRLENTYTSTVGSGSAINFTDSANNILGQIRSITESTSNIGLSFTTYNSGSSEKMRIDAAGNVGIGISPTARNNTRLQILDGIGFPATQVASTDVNTLDDYEEGNWTPSIGGTATYTTQVANYTKIGNKVFFSCNFEINIIGSGSTTVISGLPFTSGASYYGGAHVVYYINAATAVTQLVAYTAGGTATLVISSSTAAAGVLTSSAFFGNSARIILNGHYTV